MTKVLDLEENMVLLTLGTSEIATIEVDRGLPVALRVHIEDLVMSSVLLPRNEEN
jgi:hypothetical protein